MIVYKCDRCGKILSSDWQNIMTADFKIPDVWSYFNGPIKYPIGEYHFCSECMEKIVDCINELGRNE